MTQKHSMPMPSNDQTRLAKLLAFKLTDTEATEDCAADVRKAAKVSDEESRIIAAAYRAKVLPSVARQEGLTDSDVQSLLRTSGFGSGITADFAKEDKSNPFEGKDEDTDAFPPDGLGDGDDDEDDKEPGHEEDPEEETLDSELKEHGHIPTPDEEAAEGEKVEDHSPDVADAIEDTGGEPFPMKKDDADDSGEAKDNDMATIKLMVPKADVEKLLPILQQLIGEGANDELGGDEDTLSPDYAPADDPIPAEADAPQATSRKDPDMTPGEIMAYNAAQKRTAAVEENPKKNIGLGRDTSDGTYGGEHSKPYSYKDDAQVKAEDTYGTFTFDGSEGNSLREQNTPNAKQKIPTNNPQYLGLTSGLEASKKDGTPDGTLDYTIEFDTDTHVPASEGRELNKNIDIPTQTGAMPRKMTVASTKDEAETVLFNMLVTAGVKTEVLDTLTAAQGFQLYREILARNVNSFNGLAKMANVSGASLRVSAEKENGEVTEDDRLKDAPDDLIPSHKSEEAAKKAAADFRNRLKAAYSVSTQMVLAGVIEREDVDGNVDLWMQDNMSVKAMCTHGAQLLRLAQSSGERVAAAQADRMTRTASINPTIAAIPAFASQNVAVADLQDTLRSGGFWTVSSGPTPEKE